MSRWQKQPGEVFDKRGVPIYPGDLIRSYQMRKNQAAIEVVTDGNDSR